MIQVRAGLDVVGHTLAECDTAGEALAFCRWLQRERERLVIGFRAEQEAGAEMRATQERADKERGKP